MTVRFGADEPVSAGKFNRAFNQVRAQGKFGAGKGFFTEDIIFLNSTGAALRAGEVATISDTQGAHTDGGKYNIELGAITTDTKPRDVWVAARGIEDDTVGPFVQSRMMLMIVDVTDAAHEYAELVDAQTYLSSTDTITPYRIVKQGELAETATTKYTCVIEFDPLQITTKSYKLVTEYDDVLKCNLVGDTEPTPTVYWIAKPWLLRKTSYVSDTDYTYVSEKERDVDDGSRTWTEKVVPEYATDEIIIAGEVDPNAKDSSTADLWVNDSGVIITPSDPPAAGENQVTLAEFESGSRMWLEEAEHTPLDDTLLPDHSTDETASTVVWDRDAPNATSNRGVETRYLVDIKKSDTDDTVYFYYRKNQYDSLGRLKNITEEVQEENLGLTVKYVQSNDQATDITTYSTATQDMDYSYNKALVIEAPGNIDDQTQTVFTAEDC